MLLMVTPILTCAMPFCPMKGAQAATEESSAATPPPCHRTSAASQESKKDRSPMLALDCMGVNLFQPDVPPDTPPPSPSVDIVHFFWNGENNGYNFDPAHLHSIRGPPEDWSDRHHSETSVILRTQRLRI